MLLVFKQVQILKLKIYYLGNNSRGVCSPFSISLLLTEKLFHIELANGDKQMNNQNEIIKVEF